MESGKEQQEMTLKSPCDNCLLIPVCQLKRHIDIILDCKWAQDHVMSQRRKGEGCKAYNVPFPIKSLQDRYIITINSVTNKEWSIVSLFELEHKESIQFNSNSFVYFKHGGKDGKGATKRL